MSASDESIARLEERVKSLEDAFSEMKTLAKGDPGRDGKDGRDGRDAKPISLQRILAAIRNASFAPRAPAVHFDAHIEVQPADVSVKAPDVHVAPAVVNVAPAIEAQMKP